MEEKDGTMTMHLAPVARSSITELEEKQARKTLPLALLLHCRKTHALIRRHPLSAMKRDDGLFKKVVGAVLWGLEVWRQWR